MSCSILYALRNDFTCEYMCDFTDAWLFSPVILDVLSDKYIPEFISIPKSVFKRTVIGDMTGETFRRTNQKVNTCVNTPDRICWELALQQIFFTRDQKLVSDSIRAFVEQNKGYNRSFIDDICDLERKHIVNRFLEIANSILTIDEREFPFFVLKRTSSTDDVERWFEKDGRYNASMLEHKDELLTEFVLINNGEIKGFIPNTEFEYQSYIN